MVSLSPSSASSQHAILTSHFSLPSRPSEQAGRRPLDCGSLLPLSRSQPAGPAPPKPLPTSPSQISNLKSQISNPPRPPQALDCCEPSQLSLRAEHAYPLSQHASSQHAPFHHLLFTIHNFQSPHRYLNSRPPMSITTAARNRSKSCCSGKALLPRENTEASGYSSFRFH